jgi:hypothetical protein
MRTTTKTMIKLLGRANRKAGRFLIVERAAGRVIRTRFFKWHAFINHINNVNAIKQILNKTIWNQNTSTLFIVIIAGIVDNFSLIRKQKRSFRSLIFTTYILLKPTVL